MVPVAGFAPALNRFSTYLLCWLGYTGIWSARGGSNSHFSIFKIDACCQLGYARRLALPAIICCCLHHEPTHDFPQNGPTFPCLRLARSLFPFRVNCTPHLRQVRVNGGRVRCNLWWSLTLIKAKFDGSLLLGSPSMWCATSFSVKRRPSFFSSISR